MSFPRRQTTPFPRAWFRPKPSGTLLFVCLLTGWGAAQALLWGVDVASMSTGLFLDMTGLHNGEYWRFATYQLVHSDFLHFMLTMTVLLFAGREVEPIIGRRHVLGLCLVANLVGGAASLALQPFDGVYGSSAAAMALLAAYATILPEIEHRVRFLGLVPLRFRTRHAVLLLFALALCGVKFKVAGDYGPAGMAVGALIGWVWSRALGFGRLFWFQRAAGEREALERRHERMSADEFIAMEVDPILEKIASDGMRSLSRAERRVLERAKEKIEEKSAT
jgi:membrane associated rhomboid family serine protease